MTDFCDPYETPKPPALTTTRRPRVYVAASGRDLERPRLAIAALEAAGADITKDWTRQVEALGGMNGAHWRQARIHAVGDIDAVRRADAVLFLIPPPTGSPGAHVEFGVALALGVPVVVAHSPDAESQSIFYAMADVEANTDEVGVEAVLRLALRRAETTDPYGESR